MELHGFTVGMNGEDGDFTLRASRLGYRTWMDTKIVVYEDVPPTYPEIREQRVRWGRAVHHNQARHGPYRAGVATPKVWFNQTQQFVKSAFAPARLLLPLYLLLTALFEGTERNVILIFLGGYVLAEIVFMALQAVLTLGFRQARHFGWVVLWPVWHEFLMVFATEAWLSDAGPAPGRPRHPTGGHHPGGHPLMAPVPSGGSRRVVTRAWVVPGGRLTSTSTSTPCGPTTSAATATPARPARSSTPWPPAGVRFDNVSTPRTPRACRHATALSTGQFGIRNGAVNHGGPATDLFPEGAAPGLPHRGRHAQLDRPAAGRGGVDGVDQHLRRAPLAPTTSTPASTSASTSAPGAWRRPTRWRPWPGLAGPGTPPRRLVPPRPPVGPAHPLPHPGIFGDPFAGEPLPDWLTEEVRAAHWGLPGPHSAQELAGFGPRTCGTAGPASRCRRRRWTTSGRIYDGYDTGVRYADHQVGRLLGPLDDLGLADDDRR